MTMRMSTAKEGTNPTIIPIMKDQVVSIILFVQCEIEYCLADWVTGIAEPILR
jgi:hypothetical protein